MKLKITEQQLKFIIENEIPDDNIMEINMKDYEDIEYDNVKIIKILRNCKLKKCNGIKITGRLNLSNFKGDSNLLEAFCNKLVEIYGDLYLENTTVTKLPLLTIVRGDLNLNNTPIESLPMLSTVWVRLLLKDTPIEELPKLEYAWNLDLENTPLGKKLKKTMSEEEIKNKFGIKFNLFI